MISKKIDEFISKWNKSETVKEIYQARWVWYHTILAIELLIIIFLQIGILVILGLK